MQAALRSTVLTALVLGAVLAPARASAQPYPDPNNPQYPQYYDPSQGQYGGAYPYPYSSYSYPYGYPPYGGYGYPPYGGYGYGPYGYPPYGYSPYSYYGQYGYNPYPYSPYGSYGYGQYGYSAYGYSAYGYPPYGQYGYSPYGYGAPYPPGSAYYPGGGYLPYNSPYTPYGSTGNPCYGGGSLTLSVTQSGNSALLSWNAYPGATSYNLLQGVNGAPPTLLKNIPGGTTDIEYLQPGNTYVWQLQAIVNGVPMVTSPPTQPVTATPMTYTGVPSGIVSPSLSRIVAAQQCASVAGGTTVTVQVRDTNNMPMINQPVWVQALTPNAIVSPNQLNTDAGGNTPAFTVRAQYPGPVDIGATVNGVSLQPVTIYFQ
ncbi:MAG TPA: Ig-like domain-containing protein [Chloroflexota bacterium]|jgi:hypothetical protein|nr:Ig-like domain-containing protein [Chloroflexota bacterium]